MAEIEFNIPKEGMSNGLQAALILAMVRHVMYIRNLIPENVSMTLKKERMTKSETRFIRQYSELKCDVETICSAPHSTVHKARISLGSVSICPREGPVSEGCSNHTFQPDQQVNNLVRLMIGKWIEVADKLKCVDKCRLFIVVEQSFDQRAVPHSAFELPRTFQKRHSFRVLNDVKKLIMAISCRSKVEKSISARDDKCYLEDTLDQQYEYKSLFNCTVRNILGIRSGEEDEVQKNNRKIKSSDVSPYNNFEEDGISTNKVLETRYLVQSIGLMGYSNSAAAAASSSYDGA